jgi:hypothetical protein
MFRNFTVVFKHEISTLLPQNIADRRYLKYLNPVYMFSERILRRSQQNVVEVRLSESPSLPTRLSACNSESAERISIKASVHIIPYPPVDCKYFRDIWFINFHISMAFVLSTADTNLLSHYRYVCHSA